MSQGKPRTFTSKVADVFERALFESDLTAYDKRDIGVAYMDYIREMASNVSQVKAVQSKLRDANVLQTLPLTGAAGPETQELNMPGSILGKR